MWISSFYLSNEQNNHRFALAVAKKKKKKLQKKGEKKKLIRVAWFVQKIVFTRRDWFHREGFFHLTCKTWILRENHGKNIWKYLGCTAESRAGGSINEVGATLGSHSPSVHLHTWAGPPPHCTTWRAPPPKKWKKKNQQNETKHPRLMNWLQIWNVHITRVILLCGAVSTLISALVVGTLPNPLAETRVTLHSDQKRGDKKITSQWCNASSETKSVNYCLRVTAFQEQNYDPINKDPVCIS